MGFSPERLKDIRVLNGYTVEAVAEQLGVTKQAVSKYETGQAIPSADVLTKIITLFSLPTGYLTKDEVLPKKQSAIFYRRNQRTPNRELEKAKVNLKWFYEMIEASKEVCTVPSLDIPHFPEAFSIEEKAQKLREFWGIGEQPINDMAVLLERHGFYLFTISLENRKIDGYSQFIGEFPIIILNLNKGSKARKNFSLAHELGHLILHSEIDEINSDKMEEEADVFAGCFLMPQSALEKDIIRIDAENFVALGEKWHVSPQAVLERCGELGLLEQNQGERKAHMAYLYQKLNKMKNYYVAEEKNVCSLKKILETIDAADDKRGKFLNKLCFPVQEIQRLCQMPTIFENYIKIEKVENAGDIDGVQLSFMF